MFHKLGNIPPSTQKGVLERWTKWETFRGRRGRDKESESLCFLWGMEGAYEADNLTNADQEILDLLF